MKPFLVPSWRVAGHASSALFRSDADRPIWQIVMPSEFAIGIFHGIFLGFHCDEIGCDDMECRSGIGIFPCKPSIMGFSIDQCEF